MIIELNNRASLNALTLDQLNAAFNAVFSIRSNFIALIITGDRFKRAHAIEPTGKGLDKPTLLQAIQRAKLS